MQSSHASRAAPFASAPACFVAQASQECVRFHARHGAVDVWVSDGGWRLALRGGAHAAVALDMTFEGAPGAPARALDCTPTRVSDLRGADPSRWTSEMASTRVGWCDVAPRADVVMRAGGAGFEYDLELAPGGEASDVRIRCDGHDGLSIAADGSLEIATALGVLRQPPPVAWSTDASGERAPLACRYRVLDSSTFTFEMPERDAALAATIDPALRWSTYLNGEFDQTVDAIAVAPDGRVFAAGQTGSLMFPTTLGAFDPYYSGGVDAFVSCLAADGTHLEWSTYLGGLGDDAVHAMALARNGELALGGETASADFPATAGAYDTTFGGMRDGFLARLSKDGSRLIWASFLGGTAVEHVDAIALASNGTLVAVGATQGSGFPVTTGAYDTTYNGGAFAGDAFVLRMRRDGSQLEWSTFAGGTSNEGATRVALAPDGAVVFGGRTYSNNFPVTPGSVSTVFHAPSREFVASVDSHGQTLRFATYLGGSSESELRALAVRPTGEILCAGTTLAADFPTTLGVSDATFAGPSEGFVAELAPLGNQIVRSTFFGGGDEDSVAAIALEKSGVLVIGGDTLSQDLTTTPGAFGRVFHTSLYGTPADVFVAKLSADFRGVDYATYFGSDNDDRLRALALSDDGEALLAGQTQGANFPTSASAFQPTYNITAVNEVFAARLAFLQHPIAFGSPKLNSGGTGATLFWSGFASVADHHFQIGVEQATPQAWANVFSGTAICNWPFLGGRLRVQPPLVRYPRFHTDVFGYGVTDIALDPAMVGRTLYFQAWYADSSDPYGGDLTDALRVLVYP